jgi:thioester reductase-like protein
MMGGGTGGMMGGGMGDMPQMMSMMMDHMAHMMSMMHEKVAHAPDRLASLKSELKITEAQTPAWNKFADALLAASKSTEQSVEGKEKQMTSARSAASLPDELERHAKMAASNAANLNAIKAALDPLYASFSDEQKKIADALKIDPMGLM